MKKGKPITLDEVAGELEGYIQKLTALTGEILQADGGNGYSADFMALPILHRSIKLIQGFLSLGKEKNYICAIPLIRLQLDNSLRFFATTLVNRPEDVVDTFLNGGHIGNLDDRNGKKMLDNHLTTELNKLFPGVKKLYKDTSGYIHLSDKHFQATLDRSDPNNKGMVWGAGHDGFTYEEEVNFTYQMAECCKLVFLVVGSWKDIKQGFADKRRGRSEP